MLYLPLDPGYRKQVVSYCLNAYDCYFISADDDMTYARRFLEYCEMIYVTAGELFIQIAGREYVISAGEIFVMPSFQTVDGIQHYRGKNAFYTVDFTCSDNFMNDLECTVFSIRENRFFFNELFSRLNLVMMDRRQKKDFEADAIVLSILCRLHSVSVRKEGNGTLLLNDVLEYLNEHVADIVSVDEIASHFGYNKDYLMKIFREQYGVTIKKYMNETKLTMVKRLLITTKMPISKIGETIGFEDGELFDKYFKYHEKVTPLQYRKMYS